MIKLKKTLLLTILSAVFITVSGCTDIKLSLKAGNDNILMDKEDLKSEDSVILSDETVEIDKIEKLNISCDLTNIELEETEDDKFTLEIVNIDSKEAGRIEYKNDNQVVTISNKSSGKKRLGVSVENYTKYEVILKGPVNEIQELFIKNSFGCISVNGANSDNLFIDAYLSNLEINDSILKNIKSNIDFCNVEICSSKFTNLNMVIKKSSLNVTDTEMFGKNIIDAMKVAGKIGLNNYKEVYIGEEKKPNIKASLDINKVICLIDIVDENDMKVEE